MLARIAHELFWLGRNLARAEHTARMLDGVFQASLQGRPDDPAGVTLDWSSLLAIMGAPRGDGPIRREEVLRALTVDRDNPASVLACVTRAREGARTARDVISAEMWEAVNTTSLELAETDLSVRVRTGPSSVYRYVKERCALFWGLTSRTMLRDEASAFLAAGGRIESADMVLRMLRVALPREAPARADHHPRNSEPVLRLQRLSADLEFRGRAEADNGDLHATCEAVQEELARVDRDVADRYFAGAPGTMVSV